MRNFKQKAIETAKYLKDHIKQIPEIGLFTGTGLGETAESLDIALSLEYKDVPHFPVSTVESHTGKLLIGRLEGKQVIAMQGRFHLYEGYSPLEVTFPIRVMQELGIKVLVLSNAAGGLNPGFNSGDIMIITDHINLTGSNPLTGQNEESWGIRFPDMVQAYDNNLTIIAKHSGKDSGTR